ncbi:MAG: hypothetical protein R6U96_18635 [Promethearchaeia archaeon]
MICDYCGKLIINSRTMHTFDNPYFKRGAIHKTFCSKECKMKYIKALKEIPKLALDEKVVLGNLEEKKELSFI